MSNEPITDGGLDRQQIRDDFSTAATIVKFIVAVVAFIGAIVVAFILLLFWPFKLLPLLGVPKGVAAAVNLFWWMLPPSILGIRNFIRRYTK